MKRLPLRGRSLALLAIIVPLLALFIYVGVRSGPLAPVSVTLASVQASEIRPALFGIGAVEARYVYKIGPTAAGRVKRLDVHVGDAVRAGQLLGEMDPVDLDHRVRAQEAAFKRAQALVREAQARHDHAARQAQRYERLFAVRSTSEEIAATKRQELQIAEAALAVAQEELARVDAEREALVAQRGNLRLIAPVAGVVVQRDADPGTTLVAGQTVVEVIDPASLWINVRFDQLSAAGLASGLPARIALRSQGGQLLPGRVLRVEPKADAVTEETLAKVVFDQLPQPFPPVGELAEVTVELAALPAAPTIPNAAVRRQGDRIGVWRVEAGALRFIPVTLGATDLDGAVQVRDGLAIGDQVVVYSEKALSEGSTIQVVERLAGALR